MSGLPLFEINPALDRAALAARFAKERRLQIADFLTAETAATVHRVLEQETSWGVAWQAGRDGPHALRAAEVAATPAAAQQAIGQQVTEAMRARDYAFLYAHYPMLDAYLGRWEPGGPHDLLLEHLNTPDTLDFVRQVSGMADIVKGDAQATLYRPGQFLALHDDTGKPDEHRRLAYVLNLTAGEWRPDWGGFLLFHDADGNVTAGFRPRFNTLNIFAVPQSHSVGYVAPFAPVGRFAITGWFRNG